MKFHRVEKYGQLEITARKLRLMESKPERERKALAAKLPLLADLLPQAAPVDVRAAVQERQRRADASEQASRAAQAILGAARSRARCWPRQATWRRLHSSWAMPALTARSVMWTSTRRF